VLPWSRRRSVPTIRGGEWRYGRTIFQNIFCLFRGQSDKTVSVFGGSGGGVMLLGLIDDEVTVEYVRGRFWRVASWLAY